MGSSGLDCIICGEEFEIDLYGDGNCPNCGQRYEYEEHYQIVLSKSQVALLKKQINEGE